MHEPFSRTANHARPKDLGHSVEEVTDLVVAEVRREMEERQEAWDKAHPTAHPWKPDPHLLKVPPPGVIQFADLYIIFEPKKKI